MNEMKLFCRHEKVILDKMSDILSQIDNFCAGDCYKCSIGKTLDDECVFGKTRLKRNRDWINNRYGFIEQLESTLGNVEESEVSE